MVQDIEELGPELNVNALRGIEGLGQREVPVAEARPAEDVAPARAEPAHRLPQHPIDGNSAAGREVRDRTRITDQIPAVAELSGQAGIVLIIDRAVRLAALQRDDGVGLPAFEQVERRSESGQVIAQRHRVAVADIEIAAGPFGSQVEAVLRLRRTLQRSIVDRVRPGIAGDVTDSVPEALRQRRLQSVIVGTVDVADEIDEPQKRESAVERAAQLLSAAVDRRIDLVDVADAVELDSANADISHLQGG